MEVPYVAFESALARLDRTNKRLIIIISLLILLLIGSNLAWLYYESQFEDVVTSTEIEQSADRDSSLIAVGGDYYGETNG